LRSAQRFFIASESRLLPSGVSVPRFFAFIAVARGMPTFFSFGVRVGFVPSNAAMARPILSLSCIKSAIILFRSKIRSLPPLA
jgi:hypothetical protein